MCMKKYCGCIVVVGDVTSFCSNMTRAVRLGRFLCSVYKQETFTVTITSTGDTATFSKDTIVHDDEKVASPQKKLEPLF
jgi:hypothetical protein